MLIRTQQLGYDRSDPLIMNTREANEKLYRKVQIREAMKALKADNAIASTADNESAGIISRLRLAIGRG